MTYLKQWYFFQTWKELSLSLRGKGFKTKNEIFRWKQLLINHIFQTDSNSCLYGFQFSRSRTLLVPHSRLANRALGESCKQEIYGEKRLEKTNDYFSASNSILFEINVTLFSQNQLFLYLMIWTAISKESHFFGYARNATLCVGYKVLW